MKIYRLPNKTEALIFDMDLTLYSHEEYGRIQIDTIVAMAGKKLGKSFEDINAELEACRVSWAASHGGKKPSLSNIILSWGFTMEDIIKWREEAYDPENYLKEDPLLRKVLLGLSKYKLGIVTNNPVSIAKRTLVCLGVEDCFITLVGLDTCRVPKPSRLPFEKISELLQVTPDVCVSIGDRFDIDLKFPLEMGMGAIQVDGAEDVYKLPEALKQEYK